MQYCAFVWLALIELFYGCYCFSPFFVSPLSLQPFLQEDSKLKGRYFRNRAFNVSKLSLNFDNFFILGFFVVEDFFKFDKSKKNMGFWQNPFISDRVAG